MHSLLLLPTSPFVLLPRPQSWVNYSPSPCLPATAGCQLPKSRLFAGPCLTAGNNGLLAAWCCYLSCGIYPL